MRQTTCGVPWQATQPDRAWQTCQGESTQGTAEFIEEAVHETPLGRSNGIGSLPGKLQVPLAGDAARLRVADL